MRFSLRTLFLVTLAVAVLITGGLWVKREIGHGVGVAYASWGCGELLVDFMESNCGQWPEDAHQLEKFFESSGESYVGLGSFAYLERNFEIDFTFDPATESASWISDPTARRVVNYRHGGAAYVGGHEANSRILQYLIKRQAVTRSSEQPP